MKIAISQIDTTIGDFDGNARKIIDGIGWAKGEKADLVVFPELSVCGYPPRDLLEKPTFVDRNLECVDRIAREAKGIAVALGFVSFNETKSGHGIFNSAGILKDGKLAFVQHKTLLPQYDVFDEGRHFEPAHEHKTYELAGVKIGLSLCEDLWSHHEFMGRRLYHIDPIEKLVEAGADMIVNLSASPFSLWKQAVRRQLVCDAAGGFGRPIVYCNLVGGNDELVFDGRSLVADGEGRVIHEGKAFATDAFVIDTDVMKPTADIAEPCEEEEIRRALVLGLRDYMKKCGFERAVIGLSGGIDSAVTAAIASEAIGGKRVIGVMMPSKYSSKESITDSQKLASNLGIVTCTESIADIYEAFRHELGFSDDKEVTLAEENLQARIRGNILMAISNKEGALVISTGNKSELSVGYCTLYGDMVGGFALISDIPKTMVYKLARHINRDGDVIPQTIIDKAPSAELKPDQTDQDSLPPYDTLDSIIRYYVEDGLGVDAIVQLGFERDIVKRVIGLIDTNEYKRRQAAPGIKITSKAFGTGRRFPIAWKP